jgi:hypothetical protein
MQPDGSGAKDGGGERQECGDAQHAEPITASRLERLPSPMRRPNDAWRIPTKQRRGCCGKATGGRVHGRKG